MSKMIDSMRLSDGLEAIASSSSRNFKKSNNFNVGHNRVQFTEFMNTRTETKKTPNRSISELKSNIKNIQLSQRLNQSQYSSAQSLNPVQSPKYERANYRIEKNEDDNFTNRSSHKLNKVSSDKTQPTKNYENIVFENSAFNDTNDPEKVEISRENLESQIKGDVILDENLATSTIIPISDGIIIPFNLSMNVTQTAIQLGIEELNTEVKPLKTEIEVETNRSISILDPNYKILENTEEHKIIKSNYNLNEDFTENNFFKIEAQKEFNPNNEPIILTGTDAIIKNEFEQIDEKYNNFISDITTTSEQNFSGTNNGENFQKNNQNNFVNTTSIESSQQSAAVLDGVSSLEELPFHVKRMLDEAKDILEIRLDPLELGKIEIRLERGEDDKITAHIVADEAKTHDLLLKDSSQLEKTLRNSGMNLDTNGMQFSLRQNNDQQQNSANEQRKQQDGSNSNLQEASITSTENSPAQINVHSLAYNRIYRPTRMDLRI